MKSGREAVATMVSSIISQVLVILLLLLSSFSFSSTSIGSSEDLSQSHPSPPLLSSSLLLHLSLLLVLLLLLTPAASDIDIASSISLISSSSLSPSPSPSPSRKRKRRFFHLENNYSRKQHHSSSSSSSSISDGANCSEFYLPTSPLLPPLSDPDIFKVCFRMSSVTFEWLSGLLEPLLECRDPSGSSLNLSADVRLGIGLFRLASGSPYPDISRRFGVSESTARFCTKQLCRVLCTNFRFWVAFPNPPELESVSASFEALGGFPNCCGIIQCTRFQILREVNEEEEEVGSHPPETIATQIVVDSASRILNIVTGFRGHKGDSVVLESSSLFKDVQGGHLLSSPPVYLKEVAIPQYLVGDGGYPLLPWLMVPFLLPTYSHTSFQDDFNAILHSMRRPALRTLASLRNWGILNRPIQEDVNMAVACIGACSILHNVLLMREDLSALSDGIEDYSFHDPISRDYGLEESSTSTDKASSVRNALAARARELRADLSPRRIAERH